MHQYKKIYPVQLRKIPPAYPALDEIDGGNIFETETALTIWIASGQFSLSYCFTNMLCEQNAIVIAQCRKSASFGVSLL